jgi:hypothetical protein
MIEDVKNTEKPSIIVIRFADIGSALFDAQIDNVTPIQLLAIAEYLRIRGEASLIQAEMESQRRAQMTKIATPGSEGLKL